jgi:hypothetical protein
MDSTAGLDTENMDYTAELYSEKSISPQVRFRNTESTAESAKIICAILQNQTQKYGQQCRTILRNMDITAESDSEKLTTPQVGLSNMDNTVELEYANMHPPPTEELVSQI